MSGFKEPSFADRQKAAQEARKNILSKFRSQPGPDDPAVKARQAEREALAAERAKAKLAREAVQGRAQAARGRGGRRGGSPAVARKGRGRRTASSARSRAESCTRRALRRAAKEEMITRKTIAAAVHFHPPWRATPQWHCGLSLYTLRSLSTPNQLFELMLGMVRHGDVSLGKACRRCRRFRKPSGRVPAPFTVMGLTVMGLAVMGALRGGQAARKGKRRSQRDCYCLHHRFLRIQRSCGKTARPMGVPDIGTSPSARAGPSAALVRLSIRMSVSGSKADQGQGTC